MKIKEVKDILEENFPAKTNWPGREAEIMVLARICSTEEEVLNRMVRPNLEYTQLILEQQRAIELYDPEARIELEEQWERLERIESQRNIETEKFVEDKDALVDFLEKNFFKLSRSQLMTIYHNCKNLAEMNDLLGSPEFDELVREMEKEIEEQGEWRERMKETKLAKEEPPEYLREVKRSTLRVERQVDVENKGEEDIKDTF